MELTARMTEVLEKFKTFNAPPIESVTPEVARQLPELRDAVLGVVHDHMAKRIISGVIEPVYGIEHVQIPGPAGNLLARIYRPSGEGPHPVLLYFHGGGWVIGDLNSYDASCRSLCNGADCIVVSVAYRQAPEHKYPAAHEDAYASYQWLLRHVASIGGDRERIAIGGESAGANLATSVCLMAKQAGLVLPVYQMLIYPVTDSNFNTSSYIEHAKAAPLSRDMMKWFFKHYFEDRKLDAFAFPLQARDLSGMPTTLVVTAESDPLRSEGEAYADKLKAAGVTVSYHCYKGVTHEFFGMGAVIDTAKDAMIEACNHLQAAFDGRSMSDESNRLHPELDQYGTTPFF